MTIKLFSHFLVLFIVACVGVSVALTQGTRVQAQTSSYLAAPFNVWITSTTNATIHLQWSPVAGASSYAVEWRLAGTLHTYWRFTTPIPYAIIYGELAPYNNYEVRIQALNAFGVGGMYTTSIIARTVDTSNPVEQPRSSPIPPTTTATLSPIQTSTDDTGIMTTPTVTRISIHDQSSQSSHTQQDDGIIVSGSTPTTQQSSPRQSVTPLATSSPSSGGSMTPTTTPTTSSSGSANAQSGGTSGSSTAPVTSVAIAPQEALVVEDITRSNGTLEYRYFRRADKTIARVDKYEQNGSLSYRAHYRANGTLEWALFYASSGTLETRIYYRALDEKLEIVQRYRPDESLEQIAYYRPDGTISSKESYRRNGKLHRVEVYSGDATLQEKQYYRSSGSLNKIEYYRPDGTLKYKDYYPSSGTSVDRRYAYRENGNVSIVIYYYSNKQFEKKEYYRTDGSLSHIEYFNSNGEKDRTSYYDQRSKLARTVEH